MNVFQIHSLEPIRVNKEPFRFAEKNGSTHVAHMTIWEPKATESHCGSMNVIDLPDAQTPDSVHKPTVRVRWDIALPPFVSCGFRIALWAQNADISPHSLDLGEIGWCAINCLRVASKPLPSSAHIHNVMQWLGNILTKGTLFWKITGFYPPTALYDVSKEHRGRLMW